MKALQYHGKHCVSPKSMLPFYALKDLQTSSTKHDTTSFWNPLWNHVKKALDIHLENHGENQAHIGSIGLHHTFQSIQVDCDCWKSFDFFWKSSTNWKLLKLCSDSSSPSINIYVHSEITPCQKSHGKVSKCPPILLQASCTSPTSNSWWTAAYDAPGVGSPCIIHLQSWVFRWWSSSWAKAHPGTCTRESRHQSTATCVFLARNCHTFWDRPKKYA